MAKPSIAEDILNLLESSTYRVGQAGAVAGANLQETIERAANNLTGRRGAPVDATALRSIAEGLATKSDEARSRVSAETQKAMSDSAPRGNIFKGELDLGPDPSLRGVAANTINLAPSIVTGLGSALIGRRLGGARGAVVAGGATGALQSGGEAAVEEGARVRGMTPEQLAALPAYQEAQGTPEERREIVARKAESGAALAAAPVGAFGGGLTGSLVTKPVQGAIGKVVGGGLAGRTAASTAAGAVEEGIQEVTEGLAQRVGGSLATGEKGREYGEESAANLFYGGIGGGVMGGGAALATPTPASVVQPDRGVVSRAAAKGVESGAVQNTRVEFLGAPEMPALPPQVQGTEIAAPAARSPIAFDTEPASVAADTGAETPGVAGQPIAPAKPSDWAVTDADIEQFPGLSPELRKVESQAWQSVIEDPQGHVDRYRELEGTDGGRIVNTDEARELFPLYASGPEGRSTFAAAVHEPSSLIAKRVLAENLAMEPSSDDAFVLMTGGGTGAGKTTGIKRLPELAKRYDEADFIFDGNLQSTERAVKQINRMLDSGRKVHIVYTLRDPVQAWRSGTLPRANREDYGRTVPANVQAATTVGAAKAALELMQLYKNDSAVRVDLVYNNYDIDSPKDAFVRPGTVEDAEAIAGLDQGQLTQELLNVLEQEWKAGRISDRVYYGTRGEVQATGEGRLQQSEQGLDEQGLPGRQAAQDRPAGPVSRAASLVQPAALGVAPSAAASQAGPNAGAGGQLQPAAGSTGVDGQAATQAGAAGAVRQGAALNPAGNTQGEGAAARTAPGTASPTNLAGRLPDEPRGVRAVSGEDRGIQAAAGNLQSPGPGVQLESDRESEGQGFLGRDAAPRPFEQTGELSTRVPTGKKATEDALGSLLTVDLDAVKADPKLMAKLATTVSGYLNTPKRGGTSDPAKQIERFVRHVERNLLELHDRVPADIRNRSKLWYDGAHKLAKQWAVKYGITKEEAAGVIAALSPQMDWFSNVSLAERTIDTYLNHNNVRWNESMTKVANKIMPSGKNAVMVKAIKSKTLSELSHPAEIATWIRIYDETHNARFLPVTTPEGDYIGSLQGNKGPAGIRWQQTDAIAKAVSIMQDPSAENISAQLGGAHKVRSFYNNIVAPNSDKGHVTIDTHAVAAALMRPLSSSAKEVNDNLSGQSSDNLGLVGTYPIYAEAYRRAAAKRGILPREMQSITWEAIRGLYTAPFKAADSRRVKKTGELGVIDQIWSDYQNGRITEDQARERSIERGGRIRDPEWVKPRTGLDEEKWSAAYRRAVASSELPGRSAGVLDRVPDQGAGDPAGSVGVAGLRERRPESTGAAGGRLSGRSIAPLAGYPESGPGPDARLVAVAEQYAREAGIELKRQSEYVKVNKARAERIAQAYAEMEHAPQDPRVQRAYAELIRQTTAQYRALEKAGYKFWLMDPAADPYGGNPAAAMRDLRENQSMAVFPTDAGFGSGAAESVTAENAERAVATSGLDFMTAEGIAEYNRTRNDGGSPNPEIKLPPWEEDSSGMLSRPAYTVDGDLRWLRFADWEGRGVGLIVENADGTEVGFYPVGLDISQNPLLADTGIKWPYGSPDGELRPVLANDLFRAVHDAFGHGLEGAGFRARGEENAWQAHVRLFTGDAIGAITSETRGQNSWLNYGPYGEQNRNAKVEDTVFADQKTGLLPEWVWTDGRATDAPTSVGIAAKFKVPASIRTSRIYSEMDGDEKASTKAALKRLEKLGYPKAWMNRVSSFFTHSPSESFAARFYLYGDLKGSVSIREDQFDDVGTLVRNLAHELAHAADYDQGVEGFFSESSPLFETELKDGKVVYKGELIKELNEAYENGSPLAYELAYPFDQSHYGFSESTLKVEAFAQGVMLYFSDRAALKKHAPNTYKFVEGLVNEQSSGNTRANEGNQAGVFGVQTALRSAGARKFDPGSVTGRDAEGAAAVAKDRRDQQEAEGREQRSGDRGSGFLGVATAPPPSTAFDGFTLPSWELSQYLQQQAGSRIDAYRGAAKAGGDKLRTLFQDYFLPVRRVQEAIGKLGGRVDEDSDVYGREELYYGRTGEQLREIEDQHVKPLVKALAGSGVEQADLELYLYAKFAPARNARIAKINPRMPDGGSGMTDADAAQILADFDAAGLTPKLSALAKRVRELNKLRIDTLEAGGLLSKDEADLWRQEPDYVPLKGFAEDVGEQQGASRPRTGQGFSIGGREAHRALGRQSRATDILANTVAQVQQAVIRAEKNRVAQALLRLAQNNPNEDLWTVDVTPQKPQLSAAGEVVYRPDTLHRLKDNVVSVKVDGKQHFVTLHDQRLADAMKNLGAAKTGAFLRAFASINRFLSLTRTMLAPEFVLANFSRDIQTAAINLTGEQSAAMAGRVVADTPKAMRAMWAFNRGKSQGGEWDRWAREFTEAGGMTAFVAQQTVEEQQAHIQGLLNEAKGGTKAAIRALVRGTFELVEDANGAVENATRLSAYANARRAGMSTTQAARLAKNLTVNFNRKGQLGPVANSLYLFYNASIQGTQRFLRAMRSPAARNIMAGTAMLGYMLAMHNRAAGGEDDDGEDKWDKVQDWEKSRNLIFMMADGSTVKIPLPYTYNLPFLIGTQIEALTNGKKKPSAAAATIAESILTSFSPFGDIDLQGDSSIAALKLASPTAIDPFVDIAVNRNFFGAPINPERSPFDKVKDPDSQLAFPSVNPGARWLANALNTATGGDAARSGAIDVSPGSMVYIFDYLTGGTGAFVERTATSAMLALQGESVPANKIPFLRVVRGELSDRRATDTFYRLRDDVNLGLELIKTGVADESDRVQVTLARRLEPLLKMTERRLRDLRDQRKRAKDDEIVKRIKERELETQRRFNARYFSVLESLSGQD